MGLYSKYVLPKVIDWTCKQKPNRKQREKVVPFAEGKVLEIGIGSGLNLPHYDPEKVNELIGIDPSQEIWDENNVDTGLLPYPFEFLQAFAEDIPVDNQYFDTVVTTYTLCTIPEVNLAFNEIRRVLKSSGTIIFCEHGKAPDKSVERWQRIANPLWKRVGGGCNLNRDIPQLIENNGFKITTMDTMYIPGWKPASFNFWGNAKMI